MVINIDDMTDALVKYLGWITLQHGYMNIPVLKYILVPTDTERTMLLSLTAGVQKPVGQAEN